MKLLVKTVNGSQFEIEARPQDTVADLKKKIETIKSAGVYPAAKQMLIHQEKHLIDSTTLDQNKVKENSLILIMLSENTSNADSNLEEEEELVDSTAVSGKSEPNQTGGIFRQVSAGSIGEFLSSDEFTNGVSKYLNSQKFNLVLDL